MTHKELPVRAAELQRAVTSTVPCTSTVVDALKEYLLPTAKPLDPVQVTSGASRRPKTPGPASGAPRGSRIRTKEKAGYPILEENTCKASQPTPQERFQLATEVANATLKALTEAVKRQTNPGFAQPKKTLQLPPAESNEPEPTVREALHQRCANRMEPFGRRRSSCISTLNCQSDLLARAECACMAFTALGALQAQKSLGIELPPLQLETGMAALISKLITLGFLDMATKELRTQKQRLIGLILPASDKGKLMSLANSKSVQVKLTAGQECLASLLRFPCDIAKGAVLALVITTKLQVLKVIAAAKQPSITEVAFRQIQTSKLQSPVKLILRQVTGDEPESKAVAARQLENLAQALFSLCPSVSPVEDEVATDPQSSVSPQVAIQIQQLAFEIRSESWRLSIQKGDARKELYEPLLRCMGSFCRRSNLPAHEKYKVATTCFQSLRAPFLPHESKACGRPLLDLYGMLANLAQEGMAYEEAIHWIQQSLELPDRSFVSRFRTCSLRCQVATIRIRLAQKKPDVEAVLLALKDAITALEGDISGDSNDLEELLRAINNLRRVVLTVIVEHCSQETTGNTTLSTELSDQFLRLILLGIRFLRRYATKERNPSLSDQLVLRQAHTHNLVKKAVYSFVESLALTAKTMVSAATCWQRLENGLQECTRLILTLEDGPMAEGSVSHEPGSGRQPMVLISNAYWCRFLYLRKIGGDAEDMLRLARTSIDLIKCRTITERIAGDLVTKQQKLASYHYNLLDFHEASNLYEEALRAEIGAGCLQGAAECAATQSLQEITMGDVSLTSWSQLLRVRLKATLKEGNSIFESKLVFDNEHLSTPERGLLLEQQLVSVVSLMDQNGLSPQSRRAFQHLATSLVSIYGKETYPTRRLRVKVCIMRAISSHSGFLEDDVLYRILEEQPNAVPLDSGHADIGLQYFEPHLQGCWNIAIQVRRKEPDWNAIGSSLTVWSRILAANKDEASLKLHIDNLRDWIVQLQSLAEFLDMHGLELLHASVLEMLVTIYGITITSPSSVFASTSSQLGLQYARLGYTSKAGMILNKAQKYLEIPEIPASEVIHWHLAFAEYALSIGSLAKSEQNLNIALQRFQEDYPPNLGASIWRDQGKALRMVADLYQAHSLLASARSQHAKALFFGRCAVRLCHKAWASLERTCTRKTHKASVESTESALENVTEELSEVMITTARNIASETRSFKEPRSTIFWTLTPRYLRCLMHLSQLYARNGLLPEARHYVEQAQRVANATCAISFVQQCLTLAGDFEVRSGNLNQGLEILLQSTAASANLESDRHFVNLQICLANAHALQGAWPQAERTLKSARENLEELWASVLADGSMHNQPVNDGLETALQSLTLSEKAPASRKAIKRPNPCAESRKKGTAEPKASAFLAKSVNQIETPLLVSMKTAIVHQCVHAALQQNELEHAVSLLAEVTKQCCPPRDSVLQVLQNAQIDLHQALDSVSGDPVFCSLSESTISIPSTNACSPRRAKVAAQLSPMKKVASVKKSTKKSQSVIIPTAIAEGFVFLLQRVRDSICQVLDMAKETSSTGTIHEVSDLLVKALMMLSAATPSQMQGSVTSAFSAYVSNLARTTSVHRERLAISVERQLTLHQDLFTWPRDIIPYDKAKLEGGLTPDLLAFQEHPASFMPASWRVLSISVSDAHDELRISKICSGQCPFMITLPLNRQHSRDGDEGLFGFDQAKTELMNLVGLANESTHATHDMSVKGAKTAWWEGRAALDAGLKDFLVNIENIWLGGFRGIFSTSAQNLDLLSRFQQSLYHILDKHLPSRQKSGKGRVASHVALNPRVLELFVGLGNPEEAGDLDESLTDLLYYVVDILQFHGERNAYDEIDFDSIVAETCDALRHYHEAANHFSETINRQHTILILDKSLHCFPWESLPCLQGQAVSRLPSFGCLMERVQQQKQQQISSVGESSSMDGIEVNRNEGSYVLNPAGDLTATQATFEQPLQRLQNWTSVIGRIPKEDEMKSCLSNRDVFLYFGHGSGSQYVRSRTIKGLERCAVALLMGCSSGALTEAGEFEPYGTPMNYMHAGCPAMVATLWDVTDKDIDRFSDTVLHKWGLFQDPEPPPSSSPVKKHRKPKGKVKEVTPPSSTGTPQSLDEAVASGRDSCFLRYLNGAAPVVYGVPVFLR